MKAGEFLLLFLGFCGFIILRLTSLDATAAWWILALPALQLLQFLEYPLSRRKSVPPHPFVPNTWEAHLEGWVVRAVVTALFWGLAAVCFGPGYIPITAGILLVALVGAACSIGVDFQLRAIANGSWKGIVAPFH